MAAPGRWTLPAWLPLRYLLCRHLICRRPRLRIRTNSNTSFPTTAGQTTHIPTMGSNASGRMARTKSFWRPCSVPTMTSTPIAKKILNPAATPVTPSKPRSIWRGKVSRRPLVCFDQWRMGAHPSGQDRFRLRARRASLPFHARWQDRVLCKTERRPLKVRPSRRAGTRGRRGRRWKRASGSGPTEASNLRRVTARQPLSMVPLRPASAGLFFGVGTPDQRPAL